MGQRTAEATVNYQAITKFFLWNSIINGSILILWAVIFFSCSDCIYDIPSKFLAMPREDFNKIIYAFVGLFKILFFVFNIVPLFAMLILRRANAQGTT